MVVIVAWRLDIVRMLVMVAVVVGRVIHDAHVGLVGERNVNASFDLLRVEQQVAKGLVDNGVFPFLSRCRQAVVDEVAVLEDLQDDLRRPTGDRLFGVLVQQVNGHGAGCFVVDQFGVIFFFAQHNQVPAVRTEGRVIMLGRMALGGGRGGRIAGVGVWRRARLRSPSPGQVLPNLRG